MIVLHEKIGQTSNFTLSFGMAIAAARCSTPNFGVRLRRADRRSSGSKKRQGRSEAWGTLMAAAQGGKREAYEQLVRELDQWLRGYYARRLSPTAADDARQEALLAVHLNRHTYSPSKPFGPWIAAIARYKWIDHIREASRYRMLSLNDEIPAKDDGDAAINVVAVDHLLSRLKPAQARVIRLVKLHGASIEDASSATGQSTSLVKMNIYRGLKRLAVLAANDIARPICDRRATNI